MSNSQKCLILGATGLVGNHLINLLLNQQTQYSKVVSISRRPLKIEDEKLEEIILNDLNEMKPEHFKDVDCVFCCLGTTIKTAGSKEKFRLVDFDYPLLAANIAKKISVSKFILISAKGSSTSSNVFYSKVKGELEVEITNLHLKELHIVKPSLLLGDRIESRPGEAIGQFISKLFLPVLKITTGTYSPIEAEYVAKCLFDLGVSGNSSIKNLEVVTKRG